MFGTCLRMCGNREDAEDVLQGSFADVYGKLDYFRGESTVGAWIKRIVINNCLNHLKRRRLRFTELKEEFSPAQEVKVIEVDRSLDVARIQEAVKRLPDGYRTVLSLYLFEGFDHAEIAEVLNISEQTSKSQYSRVRTLEGVKLSPKPKTEESTREGGIIRQLYPFWRKAAVACMLLTIGVLGGLLLADKGSPALVEQSSTESRALELEQYYKREIDRRLAMVASWT